MATHIPDFPAHPEDGFQIKEDLPDGGYAIWTYSEPLNQWTSQLFPQAMPGFIYTDQVKVREEHPELKTQKDVNHHLAELQEQVQGLSGLVKALELRVSGQT